ncbi:MarR family transcriptional regulator [Chitinophaga sancti]|uniref:MarR family winged helix-turn-helix transcriptional regulator n=1 Tax=Chitinophaga sancti TaxID=1004 RepID=UPI002A747610|nr:MarR family transcriptional regulator [Chitinophaga sancti]WPQ64845.1 MarR family transcriptional regulator [Chitinophaga sancti]
MFNNQDEEIAYGIRNLVTIMNKRLRKQMSNPEQLSISEFNVLSILMIQKEAFPSELGAQLSISSQFMSQILNRMEGLKYISRKSAPSDGRKTLVSLTKHGKQKVELSRREREEWLALVVSEKYTTEEKDVIKKALDLLSVLTEL